MIINIFERPSEFLLVVLLFLILPLIRVAAKPKTQRKLGLVIEKLMIKLGKFLARTGKRVASKVERSLLASDDE